MVSPLSFKCYSEQIMRKSVDDDLSWGGRVINNLRHASIARGFLLGRASNESDGVVDDSKFWRFECLLLRKLQRQGL